MKKQFYNSINNSIIRLIKIEFNTNKSYNLNLIKIISSYLILNGTIITYENKIDFITIVLLNLIILIILSLELSRIKINNNAIYDIYLIKFNIIPFSVVFITKHFTNWIKYITPVLIINILNFYIFFSCDMDKLQYLNIFILYINITYDFFIINSVVQYFFTTIKNESLLLLIILLPSYIPSVIITIQSLNINMTQISYIIVFPTIYSLLLSLFINLLINLYFKSFNID
uniref:Cyochrome c1 ABC transporter channel subunit n=1 Tax=Cyanidiococcus yangmingshanensis TaxID=2690220 RepID=A0A7H0WBE7_9RHOD|nr:cyochrome c1 ABC transporter channel subunit [Cyanidiococcus yangmingshanensis]UNJ18942.1 channel subunit of ABC transporter for cytochrome c1 [Cyanidioschyzonaceae sp. 2 FvB-2021]